MLNKKNLFGYNLRRARKLSGMSQDALAQALSVGRTTIVNWENGTSTPTIETLLEVSALLNKTPNELLLDASTYLNKTPPTPSVTSEPPAHYGAVGRDIHVDGRDSSFQITVNVPMIDELRKEVRLLREIITNQNQKP